MHTDTIIAPATATGPAERAVVRVSGPGAFAVAAGVFAPEPRRERGQVDGVVRFGRHELAALALTMPGPRSFTGEDVVELHVPGSPLLVQWLIDELLRDGAARGVRMALPGEFTARAFQNGRLDATQAEGLLLLLHAADQREALGAVQWLRGGLGAAVVGLRGELQDCLALIEAGLDFDEGDTGAVPAELWQERLPDFAERVERLLASLPAAAPGGELLLLGRANAGKSSLANALAGREHVLVADQPGTTRDLVRVDIGDGVHLWDAPGDLDEPAAADRAALALRDRLAGRASALVVVLDAVDPVVPPSALQSPQPWRAVVFTRIDLVASPPALDPLVRGRLPSPDWCFRTSARTGEGIAALRDALRRTGHSGVDAGGPLRSALQGAAEALRRAIAAAEVAPELCAVDLQAALRCLDGIAGSHDPEQLLDRIYGRFCLGK